MSTILHYLLPVVSVNGNSYDVQILRIDNESWSNSLINPLEEKFLPSLSLLVRLLLKRSACWQTLILNLSMNFFLCLDGILCTLHFRNLKQSQLPLIQYNSTWMCQTYRAVSLDKSVPTLVPTKINTALWGSMCRLASMIHIGTCSRDFLLQTSNTTSAPTELR